MVCRDTGLSNTQDQEESIQNPDLNIVSGDSDSEPEEPFGEDGLGYYTPIADYNAAGLISDSEEDGQQENGWENRDLEPNDNQAEPMSNVGGSSNSSFPPIQPIEEALLRDIWTKPTPQELDIELTDTKIDEVKLAMKNFTLPSTAIPEWAKNISEDQWKDHLLKKLSIKK